MPVGSEVRGPQVRRLDSRDTVEGIVITGENLDGASRSGSGGGDGDVWTESPPRDPAKGKGSVVMEETSERCQWSRLNLDRPRGPRGIDPLHEATSQLSAPQLAFQRLQGWECQLFPRTACPVDSNCLLRC